MDRRWLAHRRRDDKLPARERARRLPLRGDRHERRRLDHADEHSFHRVGGEPATATAGDAGGRRTGQRQGVRGRQRPVGAAVQRDADPLGHRNRCASRDHFSTSATGRGTKTQTGTFSGAIFKITQARAGASKGLTTLTLINNAFKGAPSYASCKSRGALDVTAAALERATPVGPRQRPHRQFADPRAHGRRRFAGRSRTIADRCDGTLVRDITDSLAVTDFVRHKTLILHAGQRYLARKPK